MGLRGATSKGSEGKGKWWGRGGSGRGWKGKGSVEKGEGRVGEGRGGPTSKGRNWREGRKEVRGRGREGREGKVPPYNEFLATPMLKSNAFSAYCWIVFASGPNYRFAAAVICLTKFLATQLKNLQTM